MMGSLLMTLLLLPVLAATVQAAAGDLCNKTKLTQPKDIDLAKVQAMVDNRPNIFDALTCAEAGISVYEPVAHESHTGWWYVHRHTHPRFRNEILYVTLEGGTGSGSGSKFTYTFIGGTAEGKCLPGVYPEMTVSQDGQNHLLKNITKDSTTLNLYITHMDSCYSAGIVYATSTVTATNAVQYDFAGLVVRNPKAAPNPAVVDILKTEFCQGENLEDWYQPANNVTCGCV